MLTPTRLKALYKAIDDNYRWVQQKGCTVTDHRRFIEIIIGKYCGLELDAIDKLLTEVQIGDDNRSEI